MILEFCMNLGASLDASLTRDALAGNSAQFERLSTPFAAPPAFCQTVLASSLCRNLAGAKTPRHLEGGIPVARLEAIPAPLPAEYARLISKGRILYEHCMAEVSSACVVGFMHHELTKSRAAARVIVDLLAWMLEERFQLSDLVAEQGQAAIDRMAHTDYMLDLGVSFLHGLDRGVSRALSAAREP